MTRVLMISTDAKLLEEGSSVASRMKEYGGLFSELHIVLMAKRSFHSSFFGFKNPASLSENVFVYPTNSLSKILSVGDAKRLGGRIIRKFGGASDVIVTTQDPFETGLAGLSLSKKYKLPLHVQIHTDLLSPYFVRGNILNRVRFTISRKVLKEARAVRTVSERIKRELKDERASVLPIYADISAIKVVPVPVGFKQERMKPGKTILMASRLEREKDVKTALVAFSMVVRRQSDLNLIIIGSGTKLDDLKSHAQALGIAEKIEWRPWTERSELVSYMKTCDVFLSSSLYEGYGLSMLEAHASGATLCVTNAGIAPLLAHEKNLAKPHDVNSLADALTNALSGSFKNRDYAYPYSSQDTYLQAYKADIERAFSA